MCVLADANLIPVMFSSRNKEHKKYLPITKWIIYGRAKLVFGGYYYTNEVRGHLHSYLPLILELSKFNKTHFFTNKEIDEKATEIKHAVNDNAFNDPHILALLIISRAKIFCSQDGKSFKFIKKKNIYPKNAEIPKIFSLKDHKSCLNLLIDQNICKNGSHIQLPQRTADKIMSKI